MHFDEGLRERILVLSFCDPLGQIPEQLGDVPVTSDLPLNDSEVAQQCPIMQHEVDAILCIFRVSEVAERVGEGKDWLSQLLQPSPVPVEQFKLTSHLHAEIIVCLHGLRSLVGKVGQDEGEDGDEGCSSLRVSFEKINHESLELGCGGSCPQNGCESAGDQRQLVVLFDLDEGLAASWVIEFLRKGLATDGLDGLFEEGQELLLEIESLALVELPMGRRIVVEESEQFATTRHLAPLQEVAQVRKGDIQSVGITDSRQNLLTFRVLPAVEALRELLLLRRGRHEGVEERPALGLDLLILLVRHHDSE